MPRIPQGNWRTLIRYNIELQEAFATRRHLSFDDFASEDLSHLKHIALAAIEESRSEPSSSSKPKFSQVPTAQRSYTSRPQSDKKARFNSPWAGKVKNTQHLPKNQQLCGGWNLNKCSDDKCGRIHNMRDFNDCYESQKRITHSTWSFRLPPPYLRVRISQELSHNEPGVRSYKRGYKWDRTNASGYSNAIDSSLYAAPLDRPPPIELDPCAAYAIKQYPNLFAIIARVDVNMFEHLLENHLNQKFVGSVVEGLRDGFWPMSIYHQQRRS